MTENTTFIGMDVHKNSIDIAIAETGRNGQVRHYGKIEGSLSALEKVVRKLVSKGTRLRFAYKPGPVDTRSIVTSPPKDWSAPWWLHPGFRNQAATRLKMTAGMP